MRTVDGVRVAAEQQKQQGKYSQAPCELRHDSLSSGRARNRHGFFAVKLYPIVLAVKFAQRIARLKKRNLYISKDR